MKNKKMMWVLLGTAGGVAVLGAGAYAVWNCRQLRMMRAARRAGKILYKAGAVLQSVSEFAD